jgi:hypothetical protein
MRITKLLAILVFPAALALCSQAVNPAATMQQQASSGSDTLSGCLKGSKQQYYVVEQDGTRHTVTGKDLSSHVNHQVTLTGKADTSRAAGSDAEGHRKAYFTVDSISDQGACTKK